MIGQVLTKGLTGPWPRVMQLGLLAFPRYHLDRDFLSRVSAGLV